jgi:hypothetical protein
METQTELNPRESLELIAETIAKTKENFKYQSFYYLIWGWLVAGASLFQYILIEFTEFEMNYLPWPILMSIGAIITIIYSIRLGRVMQTETYLGSFIKHLWIVLGVSFIFMLFISIKLEFWPAPGVLLLAGIGTMVSGLTMKFKPLIFGGIIFAVFSILTLYFRGPEQLLLNGVAIILGYLIPGYLLKYSKK